MLKKHYEVFVSYRHLDPDARVAAMLARQIENYRIPRTLWKLAGKKRMGKVFLDHDELPTSADLNTGIEEALAASDYLIAVSSPDYPKSKWCMKEVDTFIAQGKRDKILTLLVSGEPHESFPPALMSIVRPDGSVTEVEPLAADVRAKTDSEWRRKLKLEKLRLLAPMLGVGFDDLRRRHRERVIKLLALASCLIALGGIVFGTYAYNNAMTISRQSAALYESNQALVAANSQVEEKNKALHQTNEELDTANTDLARTNDALENANSQLADTNEALGDANTELARTNDALEDANTQLENANETLEAQKKQIAHQRDAALISQSRFLSDTSQNASDDGNPMLGLLLALEALPSNLQTPDRPYTWESEMALRYALAKFNSSVYSMYASSEIRSTFRVSKYSYTNDLQRNYMAVDSTSGGTDIYAIETGARVSSLTKAERDFYVLSTGGDYAAYIKRDDDGTDRLVVRDINDGDECSAVLKYSYSAAPQICSAGIGEIFSDVLRVAAKEGDNTLKLYAFQKDFRNGSSLSRLCSISPGSSILGYAWSPDGKRVLVWTFYDLEVYEADTGRKLAEFNGEEGGFSRDGRMLYAVEDNVLKLYDGATFKLVHSFGNADEKVIGYKPDNRFNPYLRRFSPDGSLITYPAQDGRLPVYSCETGKVMHLLSIPSVSLTWADWSFDGRKLLAVGGGKTYIFSSATGELIQTLAPGEAIYKAFFVSGSDTVCTLAAGKISFWAASPGDSVYFGDEKSVEFTFSSDGRFLYHLRNSPYFSSFAVDAKTGQTVASFGRCIWFRESPDGNMLAVYRPENHIDLYEVGSWDKPVKTLHFPGGKEDTYDFYHNPAGDMSFSPDGSQLAILNTTWGRIILFDIQSGSARTLLEGEAFQACFQTTGVGLQRIPVWWNGDGSEILALDTNGFQEDYAGGYAIRIQTGETTRIPAGTHYEQSPDGMYSFMHQTVYDSLQVYRSDSKKLLYSLENCDWACFGNGGLLLTTDSEAGLTTVRQASNGHAISSFEEPLRFEDAPYAWYETSYDGSYIAISSNLKSGRHTTIRLSSTGEIIQDIPEALSVSWSPVDNRFAPEVTGSVSSLSRSYIAPMHSLEEVIRKALEKLDGRTLSEEERKAYWLE